MPFVDTIPPLSFEFDGALNSANRNLDISAKAVAGNFCVVIGWVFIGPVSTPSGFTLTGSDTGGDDAILMAARVLDGDETTISIGDGAAEYMCALFFKPVGFQIASFSDNDFDVEITDSQPTSQTLSMSGETSLPIVGVGSLGSNLAIGSSFTTSNFIDASIADTRTNSYYKIYSEKESPANATIGFTSDTSSGNYITTAYFTFTKS